MRKIPRVVVPLAVFVVAEALSSLKLISVYYVTVLCYICIDSILVLSLNLVNDLDLRVIGPGDVYYYPNGRNSRDPLNNIERVVVPLAGQPGEYTIEITAAHVPFGPQPFALVAVQF